MSNDHSQKHPEQQPPSVPQEASTFNSDSSHDPLNLQQNTPLSSMQIQLILDENALLIQTILEYQQSGINSFIKYQDRLHRNLIYLANQTNSP